MDTVEEGVPAPAAEATAPPTLEEVSGSKPQSRMGESKKRLSAVSKMYDIDGNGELDEAELAMRDMDQTGRGYLTNEKVYKLMQEHLKDQREIFKIKKLVIGLAVFVVLLTLSNLGTSIAAAYLAKDTTTNDKDELTSSATGKALGTQNADENFSVGTAESDASERALQFCSKSGGSYTCGTTSFTLAEADAKELMCLCHRNKQVSITRTWSDNSETNFPICGSSSTTLSGDCTCNGNGSYNSGDCSQLDIGSGADLVTVTRQSGVGGGTYKIEGDAFLSDDGGNCESSEDCDSGLQCGSCFSAPCACEATPSSGGDEAPVTDCTSKDDCGPGLECLDLKEGRICGCFHDSDSNIFQGCDEDPVDNTCYQGGTLVDGSGLTYGTRCSCGIANDNCDTGGGEVCAVPCMVGDTTPTCGLKSDNDRTCNDLFKVDTVCEAGSCVDPPTTTSTTAPPLVGGGAAMPAICGDSSECGDRVCGDWDGDGVMYCGCNTTAAEDGTYDGCDSTSVNSVCVSSTSCGCDVNDASACDAVGVGYTCGLHCGIAISTPSCDLQSDRDGWCASQDASTPTCNAVTQTCEGRA